MAQEQKECDDHEPCQPGDHQCGVPIGQLADTDDADWRGRPTKVPGERMAGVGAAQSRWTDLGGQDREIGRMKNTVANTCQGSQGIKHPEFRDQTKSQHAERQ